MEALLIEEWTAEAEIVFVLDEASLSSVRDRVRAVASAGGVASEVVDRALLVASELGRNQLRHALAGRVAVRALVREGHHGLEITAVDRGSGLADAAAALDAAPRSAGSLGVGIGSVRRLSSEVDFDVRLGEGTRIKARLFGRDVPRRLEVGIYGRPHPEEKVSGDHAGFCRDESDGSLVLAVSDGLGHGPLAREASYAAMKGVYAHAHDSPTSILSACETELGSTRGVVMAAVRIVEPTRSVDAASIGNIELQVCGPRTARRFGGSSAVLGGRGTPRAPKARTESTTLGPGDLLVMTTDGISSKLAIEQDLALLREHSVVVAQRIMERFARDTDDALVLVVK